MGWTRLEPPPKAAGTRATNGGRVLLRSTRYGMVLRLVLGQAVAQRLADADASWAVGGKVEVCLGGGADRGLLRIMPAEDGDFVLRQAPGRSRGGLALRLGRNVAWGEDGGSWKLAPDDLAVSDLGALTVTLPEAVLSAKAHALPLRKAS